jgi:hypothetical protein
MADAHSVHSVGVSNFNTSARVAACNTKLVEDDDKARSLFSSSPFVKLAATPGAAVVAAFPAILLLSSAVCPSMRTPHSISDPMGTSCTSEGARAKYRSFPALPLLSVLASADGVGGSNRSHTRFHFLAALLLLLLVRRPLMTPPLLLSTAFWWLALSANP